MQFGGAALFLSPLALAMLVFALVRPLARRTFFVLMLACGLLALPLSTGPGNPFSLLPFFFLSTALGAALAELVHQVLARRRKRDPEAAQ